MIRLLRLEAVNFRSLGSVVIEPALDAGSMTALVGPNGAGKSSVVHALAWALYGETPDGVTVPGLRRQGSANSDECYVSVSFEHDGQTVSVMRGIKGARNSTVALVSVDGVEVSVSSTKSATAWVSHRLGIDADAFLTAVIVRQKELEDLVRARPADRKRLVERLAGIERMSTAVGVARDREVAAKKAVAAMGDPEEVVASVDRDVAFAEQEVADARGVMESLMEPESQARVAAEAAAEQARGEQAAWEEIQSYAKAVADAESLVREVSSVRDYWRGQVAVASENLPQDCPREAEVAAEVARLAQDSEAAREVVRQSHEFVLRRQSLTSAVAAAKVNVDAARQGVASAQQAVSRSESDLLAVPVISDGDVESARLVAREADERVGQLRADYQRIKGAIAALESAEGGCCPTCQQMVPDSAGVVSVLTGQLMTTESDGKSAREWSVEAARLANAAQEGLRVYQQAVAERDRRVQALRDAEDSLARLSQELKEAEEALEGALCGSQDILTPEAAEQYQSEVLGRLRAAEGLLVALQAHQKADGELRAAQERVEGAEEALRTLTSNTPTPSHNSGGEVTYNTVQQAWNHATETQKQASLALQALTESRTALAVAEERLTAHKQRQSQAQQAVQARKDAITTWEHATHIREGLENFRADRLERLLPELSDVTSDLVTQMTSGRFTAVQLDEAFTPIVTDDTGASRPASWLSGGEEAIVALALRIGIGEIVSGGKGGLLVLDEVLTAQDSTRRQSMMSAIRAMPGRQVLMVNHVSEASDLADEIFTFTPADSHSDQGATCERNEAASISSILEAIHADSL